MNVLCDEHWGFNEDNYLFIHEYTRNEPLNRSMQKICNTQERKTLPIKL
jgi:hypothetical protein